MSDSSNSWQVSLGSGVTAFTLTLLGQTTPLLNALGLSAQQIQDALAGLPNVGAGNPTVFQNADGSFCVTVTADLGVVAAADALIGTGTGGDLDITPISQAEASVRQSLVQMDQANAPALASAAAAVTSALNNYTGTNASWQLTVGSGVNQFTLTFLSQTTPQMPVTGLTATAIQNALQSLSSVGSNNAIVNLNSDGSYAISLTGTLANTAEPANALTGTPDAGVLTVTQTNPGNPSAGSDQNANISAAQSSFNSALSSATTAMNTIATELTTTNTEAAAMGVPADHTGDITSAQNAKSAIVAPTLNPNVANADVFSGDLNTAMATFTTQVKACFNAIITVLQDLNSENTGPTAAALNHAKNALGAIQTVGSQFNTLVQPGDQDVEAAKQADLALIQGMVS